MFNICKAKRLWSFVLFVIILFTYTTVSAQNTADLTIYTYKRDYSRAKYEPTKGVYVGAYVLQNPFINGNMSKFNELTGKKHASFFKYVGWGQPFPEKWVEQLKAVGAVPHIAWEPNSGLEEIQDNQYLRSFAKKAAQAQVPIFLRFASEANGNWTNYSGNPELYIKKWRLVHDIMEQEAPNVIIVWTVFSFPDSTIKDFYPGDEYVDWVGVNIYNVIYHSGNKNQPAAHEDPLDLLNYVYNTYSYKKPIQISEFGVSHYSATDGKQYIDFAKSKLKRMYNNLPKKYPRVKSIFYFDVDTQNLDKPNDYSISTNEETLKTYMDCVSDDAYLSEVVDDNPTSQKELLSYRGYVFIQGGKSYVDLEFFKNHLGICVEQKEDYITLSRGNKEVAVKPVKKRVEKGYYDLYKMVTGIPLRETAESLGFKVEYNPGDNSILVMH